MNIDDLRSSLLCWARNNGILSDTAYIDKEGDVTKVPFTSEGIEFFRTRKIIRIEITNKHTITLFSRLPIAKTKKKVLEDQFNTAYEEHGFKLLLDSSKPYKVTQSVDSYGKFQPIHSHKEAICCGSSIGLGNLRNAGTMTALAHDDGGTIYGLSCNHVVGGCSIAQPGTPVVSPGIQDVSTEYNQITVIGEYNQPAKMSQGIPSVTPTHLNRDLACFIIRDTNLVSSLQGSGNESYDTPTEFARIRNDLPVKKWGRSTGLTRGIISSIRKTQAPEPIEYNVVCYYGPTSSQSFKGTVYFDEIYEVIPFGSPFSLGGDSGALVVTDTKKPKIVGIVIAGDKQKSILLPLKYALKELKLKLVSKHNL